MPASIATINGQVAMAYQGEMPWHKLGKKLEGMDVPTALEAANLDWNIELQPMMLADGRRIPRRKAVVRDSDHRILAVVGDKYVPLQNFEGFSVLQPACEQFGVTIETAGALGRGDRCWMLAKLPEVIEPVAGDKIAGYFLVLLGHNGWTSYSYRLTPTRVVCANTMALALQDKAMGVLRHTKSQVEKLEEVSEMVTHLVQVLKQTGESFASLAAKKMTEVEIKEYINAVLQLPVAPTPVMERRAETIFELATKSGKGIEYAPNTMWAAFNAITEYVDHVRTAEVRSPKTIKAANESALFGQNMKLKVRALEVARRLAA